ncbi:MAG: hypothetical protein AB1486_16430 [Planctomycetota bacterium]
MNRSMPAIPLFLRLLLGGLFLGGLLLALARAACADVVTMKDGRKIEGNIEKQDASEVQVKTPYGVIKLRRSEIERIELGDTPEDTFRKRYASVSKTDPGALFDLAMWCKEQRLKKEYRQLLDEILKLRPDHDGAHEELGHVRYDGKWFTKSELLDYKKKEEEQNLARGLVLHEGRWITKDEQMLALGYQKVGDEWLTRGEADRRRSLVEIEQTFGFPMAITNSEHFSVRSTEGEDSNREILGLCEDAYNHFIGLLKPDEVERKFLDYDPINIYVLDNFQILTQWIESGYYRRYNPPKDTIQRYKEGTNFAYFFPHPVIVVAKGRHLVGGGDTRTSLLGFISHHVGHVLLRRFKRGGSVPGWIEAGIAHYYEGREVGYRTVSVCEYTGFDHIVKWVDKLGTFKEWFDALARMEVAQSLPTLADLMDRPIEEMNTREMCKGYSLVSFFIEKYPEPFVAATRRALLKEEGHVVSTREAFLDAFKRPLDELESEWVAWIETRPDLKLKRDMMGG